MKMNGGEVDSVSFLLKVDMHCRCEGCIKKIEKGFESIINFPGVLKVENMQIGELKVGGKVKPEELCKWLGEKINKKITYAPAPIRRVGFNNGIHTRPNREGYNKGSRIARRH